MELEQYFVKSDLIPAIVVEESTGQVLMLAYMNRESLQISLEEGMTCFFSRSRQTLWRKGETSGNRQHIVSIQTDCDCDALTIQVIKDGPACHTGEESCFFNCIFADEDQAGFSMEGLYQLIEGRKLEKKEGSYTTYLFEKGLDKILKKVGEECTEVIIGAKNDDNAETTYEIADLAYHVLVLMVERGIRIADIKAELARRHVVDHKVKQEKMQ